MSKFLYFNIPATGHVNPTLPVMAELVRRGETVIAYNAEPFRARVEATGAAFQAYPLAFDAAAVMRSAQTGSLPRVARLLAETAQAVLPWVIEYIRQEQPDALIYDSLCLWGYIAGARMHMPTAASITTFAFGNGSTPPLGLMLRQFAADWRDLLAFQRLYRRLRREYSVIGLGTGTLSDALSATGGMNIVFTSRAFQPHSQNFDESYIFVGPALAPRADDPPFPFEQVIRQPVVYIARGTLNNQDIGFYRACFDAFADHPGQFILSYGQSIDPAALGAIPANFIARPFVPQLDVLQRVDAFITHGGMNSVHEGLYNAVPLVVVPAQPEQVETARQVERVGAGLALGMRPPLGQVNAADLRAALDRIMNDGRFRRQAAEIGASLKAAGGAPRAADALQALARGEARV
ncbi:MAG: glycosyl transferase [Anaerolineae bacterium]|nr:glycosyl transferase [Anaerolineae bacterium]